MTIDSNLEIRKLPPSHISQLSSILESADQWKKLMAVVPNALAKNNFECNISCENPAKYNSDHIRLIERASQKYKRTGSEILLDEWGCSGRIRPAVGHLLHLLIQAELFRAADYVAEKILRGSPPKRPSDGPAALISTNINGRILEEMLDGIKYPSSLLENLTNKSLDINLNHSEKRSSIPQIIVTPDADELTSPNFNIQNGSTNDSNMTQEVSSMIQFSTNVQSDLSSEVSTDTLDSLPSEAIIPNITGLNCGPESCDIIPNSFTFKGLGDAMQSESLTDEPNFPNITQLNQETESCDNIPNLSVFNQSESANIPNISALNEDVVSNKDSLPNLSALNQSSSNIPHISELLPESTGESIKTNTDSSSGSSNSTTIPDISVSASETRTDKIESTVNDTGEALIPNLSALVPETTRRLSLNVTSSVSSKNRQCTSPLPNLTLNTHLPNFRYEELKIATNSFNEEPFQSIAEVGRFLGSGAFGKVFLATDLMDKPVAVKKILLENVEVVNIDDAVTKQFRNEVEVLSRFKHENLLLLLGYSCDGCTYCLLYEYISGGTLKDRLQSTDQKLMWQERLSIALGTAKAISYLHTAFSSPLIHRDIKTANILLDCSNKPKLGDFGITKLLNNQTTNTCTVIGTSAYMAPEALRGDISVKCDTFSFGVVLLELLTSLPTFDEHRDGNDLVTHVEEKCEDSIQSLLDVSVGDWINNDINFSDKLYEIATQCLEEKKKRPIMVDVTNMLIEMIAKV